MKKIFLIIGRTGTGKSTIAREVCERLGLTWVKSFTDRPPRPLENGENTDHIFLLKHQFDEISEETIAAYTEINGNRYCTTTDILDESDLYVIDPNGVKDLKSRCGDRYDFREIYIHCSAPVLREHYLKRGQTVEEYYQRRDAEDDQFSAYEQGWTWNQFIDNDGKLSKAVDNVCEYITKERK